MRVYASHYRQMAITVDTFSYYWSFQKFKVLAVFVLNLEYILAIIKAEKAMEKNIYIYNQ